MDCGCLCLGREAQMDRMYRQILWLIQGMQTQCSAYLDLL